MYLYVCLCSVNAVLAECDGMHAKREASVKGADAIPAAGRGAPVA